MEIKRDFSAFILALIPVSIYLIIVVWHFGTLPAHAEEFKFSPKVSVISLFFQKHKGCYLHYQINKDSKEYAEYKNARLTEYQDILCDLGVKKSSDLKLFATQLLQENGALNENKIGDHGCSIGIPQYNACAHNHTSAAAFVKTHPEWLSYRYQLKWMGLAMMDKYNRFGDSRRAIIAHNRPASAIKDQDTKAGYYAAIVKMSHILSL